MRWLVLAFAISALCVVAGGVPSLAGASKAIAASRSTATLPAPCDIADISELYGQKGPLAGKWSLEILKARINECETEIKDNISQQTKPIAIVSYPNGLPIPELITPPPCSANRLNKPNNIDVKAYEVLAYCVSWIKQHGADPMPSPTFRPLAVHTPPVPRTIPEVSAKKQSSFPTYDPRDPGWDKFVYVLGLASDAQTSAQISLQLANELRQAPLNFLEPQFDLYAKYRRVIYYTIAEPGWTVANYQQQCFNDSSTAGAIVVLQPGTHTGNLNAGLFSISFTAVGLQAFVLDCEPVNQMYTNNAAYLTWSTDVYSATDRRFGFPLATALAGLDFFLAFHPNQTQSYNIAPQSAYPPGTTYETGYTKTTNDTTGIALAAGSSALTVFNASSANVGEGANPEVQAAHAIRTLTKSIIRDLARPCHRPPKGLMLEPVTLVASQCTWYNLETFK